MAEHENDNLTPPTGPGAQDPAGGSPESGFIPSVLDWFQDPQNALMARLLVTALVLLGAWLATHMAERALTRSARRVARLRRFDEYQTRVIVGRTRPMRLIIGILITVMAALVLLGVWGLAAQFGALLAGAGFLGIVVGLAAADSLGNIVAGFVIFYNHPFDIGDWVDIEGTEGIVEDVGLGATVIMTWDNEKVTLANRAVMNARVRNFTTQRKLRRRLTVGVEYGTDLEKAMRILTDQANAHPLVLEDPQPSTVAVGFGTSSVDLQLRFYVEPVRHSAIAVYTDLVHHVHDAFRANGIVIAFPHMQVVQARPWRIEEAPTAVAAQAPSAGEGRGETGPRGGDAA